MKYLFSTDNTSSQTLYHLVEIHSRDSKGEDTGVLYSTWVSTPLSMGTLQSVLDEWLMSNEFAREELLSVNVSKTVKTGINGCIGLDSIARIISNIQPLRVRFTFYIDGDKKSLILDAEKLENLLKSLEAE